MDPWTSRTGGSQSVSHIDPKPPYYLQISMRCWKNFFQFSLSENWPIADCSEMMRDSAHRYRLVPSLMLAASKTAHVLLSRTFVLLILC